jgi:hypothetical protein
MATPKSIFFIANNEAIASELLAVIIDQFLLISNVAQVFEKVTYSQLITFLNENKVIARNQSGFRPNHSTETTLLHYIQ